MIKHLYTRYTLLFVSVLTVAFGLLGTSRAEALSYSPSTIYPETSYSLTQWVSNSTGSSFTITKDCFYWRNGVYGGSWGHGTATIPPGGTPVSCSSTGDTAGTTMSFQMNIWYPDYNGSVSYDTTSFTVATPPVSLSVYSSPSSGGSVYCQSGGSNVSCGSSFSSGTSVSVFASPVGGYSFNNWSGDCSGSGSCSVTLNSNKSVTANFARNTYTVSSTGGGSGGTISPSSQSVTSGGSTTFTVTPGDGFVASASGCSGSLSGTTYTTGTITSACTVTASFDLVSYTVTGSSGANGSISPATRSVSSGGSTTFTITPDNTNYSASASGCNGSLSGTTYTTGTITSACTVTASFTAIPPSLTPTASISNGSPLPNTASAYTLTGSMNNSGGPYSGTNNWYYGINGGAGRTYVGSAGSGTGTVTPYTGSTGNYDNVTYNFYLCANSGDGPCSSPVNLKIVKATPVIIWANPSAITYGTPLSPTQLNATANVPGTFSYNPVMGTVLSANEDDSQGLRVTFTPTNTTNYNSASKTVYIFVNKANQTISFGTLSNRIVGNAFTASATAPGGAVVFTSQTPAVCTTTGTNGATVTSVATGSCTIRASQGGDANWNPAPSVDRSFTVNPSTWSLSTTKNGTGSGTLVATGINCGTDCTETYTSGTSVTLTAYPTVGTAFSGWTGACAGQSNPCTLAMTADKATTANFTFLGYILTVNSSPALGGSISCQYSNGQSVSCRTPFLPDSTVILTAAPLNVPAPGYKLSSWTGCSSSVITCNLLMDTHKTVTANFVLKVFPPVELLIDDQLQGAGGKIRVPFGGTSILKWVGDGICTSNEFATGGAGSNTNPGVPTGPLTTVQTFSIDCVK